MRKPYAVVDITPPDVVRDELGAYDVPPGQTKYEFTLTDEQVELLAQGVVPEAISRRAFVMLGWKRENSRMANRALHICGQPGFDPLLHHCLGCPSPESVAQGR